MDTCECLCVCEPLYLLSLWSQTNRLLTSTAFLFRGDLVEEEAAEELRREDVQLIKRVLVLILIESQVKIGI